jgi:hypothetical protein
MIYVPATLADAEAFLTAVFSPCGLAAAFWALHKEAHFFFVASIIALRPHSLQTRFSFCASALALAHRPL